MSKKKLLSVITNFLKEKKCDEQNKIVHDIYLYYRGRCRGKIENVWIDKEGTAKCHIWWWGCGTDEPLETVTEQSLKMVKDYLFKDNFVK